MYRLFLCFRLLAKRPIGLISILSVMLGVGTLIVVDSVMGGFRFKMRNRLNGILADIIVESVSTDGFNSPDEAMRRMKQVAGDKIAGMAPAMEMFAILHYKNDGVGNHYHRPVFVVGVDPKQRATVGKFANYLVNPKNVESPSFELREDALDWRAKHPDPRVAEMKRADPNFDDTPIGCFVGYQIASYRPKGADADELLIRPGQEIIITTVTAGKPKPVSQNFTAVDYFKCDMSEYDGQFIFVPLSELQKIRGMGNRVTSILVKLHDYNDASEVVARLGDILPRQFFNISTWEQKQGALLDAVKVEKWLLNFVLCFIIAVAGFGILAIFLMIVVEKTRDIGILKALGASDWGVMGIFLSYALALGIVGCSMGAFLGITFTLNINLIENQLSQWLGIKIFPRDIYYFDEIPARLDPSMITWTIGFSLAVAILAAVLPALRAARLRPVESLRYE